MSEETILKAKSFEEAQRMADATGRMMEWESPSQYKPFEPELGFIQSLRLRLWLTYKRVGWAIRRRIGNITFKFTRGKKK